MNRFKKSGSSVHTHPPPTFRQKKMQYWSEGPSWSTVSNMGSALLMHGTELFTPFSFFSPSRVQVGLVFLSPFIWSFCQLHWILAEIHCSQVISSSRNPSKTGGGHNTDPRETPTHKAQLNANPLTGEVCRTHPTCPYVEPWPLSTQFSQARSEEDSVNEMGEGFRPRKMIKSRKNNCDDVPHADLTTFLATFGRQ